MDEPQVARLIEVMHQLRRGCPWDAEQTHLSLVHYLIEETLEVVDAIEGGDDTDLQEELGDLLLQVVFHAEIAAQQGRFTIDDVARGITDKLVARHPYVFGDGAIPADLMGSWEARKRAEKQRTSSLDGIPARMSALSRAHKVISRARSHGVELDLASEPLNEAEAGRALLTLAARAQASGIDPEQALRAALRDLEATITATESSQGPSSV